mgnify:CR=1 FL=1
MGHTPDPPMPSVTRKANVSLLALLGLAALASAAAPKPVAESPILLAKDKQRLVDFTAEHTLLEAQGREVAGETVGTRFDVDRLFGAQAHAAVDGRGGGVSRTGTGGTRDASGRAQTEF